MWTRAVVKTFFATHAKLLAFMGLALAVAGTTWITTHNQIEREHNDATKQFIRERNAQLRTCDRVQYLRDQANGTNFLVYDTFKTVADQQEAIIESGALKGSALLATRQSRDRSQRVVDTTVVTGPTDCNAATDHPDTYAAPAPEFIKSNTLNVRKARRQAEKLIEKARLNEPLYEGFRPMGNP